MESQASIENALNTRLVPLTLLWAQHKGFLFTDPELDTSTSTRELYTVEDDSAETNEMPVYVISKSNDGYLSGRWVDPSNPYDIAILNEDYPGALKLVEQQLQEAPDNPDLLFDKAYALSELERTQEALDLYDRLLANDPCNGSAWNNKGLALADLGRENEAHDAFCQAARIDPNNTVAQINLAHSYGRRHNMQGYFDHLEAAFKSGSSSLEGRIALHNFAKDTGIESLAELYVLRERVFNPSPQGHTVH